MKRLCDEIFWNAIQKVLCRDLFKDVLRRGVASAASAVSRQHYAGCADSRTTG